MEDFLIFKEKFLKYLNDFIKEVQLNHSTIATILNDEVLRDREKLLNIIYDYEMEIPGNKKIIREEYIHLNSERLISMTDWFIEKPGKKPLIQILLVHTSDIINRIIKYAMKIYEERSISYRKDEYLHLVEKFQACETLETAHELSSQIFGIPGTIHIKGIADRETENINSSVYEEMPTKVILIEGRRGASNTIIKNPIKMNTDAKREKIKKVLEQREKEKTKLLDFAKSYTLELKKLPLLTPEERKLILKHISRKSLLSDERVILKSTDGEMEMPNFKIEFEVE